ncbi:MAG: Pirin domain protein [Clostridia bacterium]|jgi:redox-sensitive bicupin YhaK (pirin superfamily)|nr:Pirin domain protein [Clostridia bacterium]
MENIRRINKVITGQRATDGAGVRLVRVIGYNDVKEFDPFLMLDAFDSINPEDYTKGFPWHPHRGIETVTYLIQGDIEHGDSLGNKGSILDGDCQWMTAGSGIIHQEMPKACKRMLGVQLWLNLPARDKMTNPQYRDIKSSIVPILEEEGNKVHIISGSYKGKIGAIQGDYVKPLFVDIELKENGELTIDIEKDATLFVYIIQGEGCFDPAAQELISEKHAVLFEQGDTFYVKASSKGMRILLLAAKPLKEPIAWGGPIVMNTKEELNQAFKEIDDGTFIKSNLSME